MFFGCCLFHLRAPLEAQSPGSAIGRRIKKLLDSSAVSAASGVRLVRYLSAFAGAPKLFQTPTVQSSRFKGPGPLACKPWTLSGLSVGLSVGPLVPDHARFFNPLSNFIPLTAISMASCSLSVSLRIGHSIKICIFAEVSLDPCWILAGTRLNPG